MEDWELKAREQIRDLIARYNAFGDSGRFDEVMALFSEDAVVEVVGYQTYRGRDEIRQLFSGAARPAPQSAGAAPSTGPPAAPTPIWHHTSTLVIDLQDRESARGRCYFNVFTPAGLDHWGRYRDIYRAVGERWVFAERRIRLDSMVAGGWAERNMGSPSPP